VILRMASGRIRPGRQAAFAERYATHYVEEAAGQSGLQRFHVGVGPDGFEVVALSFWDSLDAAVRAFGPAMDRVTFGGLEAEADFEEPAFFELDATWLRNRTAEPVVLRLAIGTFTKARADLDMQSLLRGRVPLVGVEMTEACVGRRIVGRSIEVLFYSAWQREPRDRSLEEAFWPDISLRYDRFSVRTYQPLSTPLRGV
jgi:hypothetical protein